MDGGYGTSQMPLAGAILCCTAIPPEMRAELSTIAAQMGAVIKLDLTSDVTHLIVGKGSSPKYRYVAKAREDVKVLSPSWLEALRTVWMEGGEVDVGALEVEYRLPTFWGLRVCVTGFTDAEQRMYIQDALIRNGAEYHGDLTKAVTHLIAAEPGGKKYEHAVHWRMNIVAYEWFEQSLERGMVLDEACYHPSMPAEERGNGAWDRAKRSVSPSLGKRPRDAEHSQTVNPLRRKLRRSASSKLGTQSNALWAGITSASLEKKREEDDWKDAEVPTKAASPPTSHEVNHVDISVNQANGSAPEDPVNDSRRPTSLSPKDQGIFQHRLVLTNQFDAVKTSILRNAIESNGATVLRNPAELDSYRSEHLGRGYLVIPHDATVDLTSLPERAGDLKLVTNWWVERCLFDKRLVDPTEHVLCRPFNRLGISGFNDLIINSTGFTGMELLHVTKVVALMGATYDENLLPKTSMIVCNSWKPNQAKLKFATENRIPAVHATWLWECIRSGEMQAFDNYLLNKIASQSEKPRSRKQTPVAEIPTAPLSEEESFRLRQKKAQQSRHASKLHGKTSQPQPLNLAVSANPTPVSTTDSPNDPYTSSHQSRTHDDSLDTGGYDGAADADTSLPLQDINPSVNSPRRPSASSTGSNTHHDTKSTSSRSNSSGYLIKPAAVTRSSSRCKDLPTPDSVIPAPGSSRDRGTISEVNDDEPKKDYSDIMSKILANCQQATTPADQADPKRRKRRQLGRATSSRSNQIAVTDRSASRASSLSATNQTPEYNDNESGTHDEEETREQRKVPEEYQPSQELGWASPGAQQAREKMIRELGGQVEERGVVQGIGRVRDVLKNHDDGESGGVAARLGKKRRN